ncbi:DUF3850 domain-containing protein [Pseudomonas kurunegalensis]|uniref:DUF3850 domain-containing protein n=1 Tax=Pseudomonas kurunegalensis TaxID=485880 RepID=UPI003D808024
MPTENRSSNTEMVSVPREHKLKIRQTPLADLLSGLKTGEVRDCSDREFAVGDTVLLREIDDSRDYTGTVLRRNITHVQKHYGLPDHLCVLSYGQPAPQTHPEPIAWMVGTAFWWTKEEAERDAAATGLPIVGLGPMNDRAAIELAESETLAAMAELAECETMADMVAEREWAEHVGTGDVSSKVEAAFTQLHNDLHEAGEKLAERDALLDDWHTANCTGEVNVSDKAYRIVTRTAAILSPVAKPIALCDQDDRSDIAADAAYRNGVMHGYKLAMEGDEAEYQACINSLTGHLQTARAALNHKPS